METITLTTAWTNIAADAADFSIQNLSQALIEVYLGAGAPGAGAQGFVLTQYDVITRDIGDGAAYARVMNRGGFSEAKAQLHPDAP